MYIRRVKMPFTKTGRKIEKTFKAEKGEKDFSASKSVAKPKGATKKK